MFSIFGKTDPKEQQRNAERVMQKSGREIIREKNALDKEETKLVAEIKKLAINGSNNKESLSILARQLLQVRKQRARLLNANSKLKSISAQNKAMQSSAKLAGAMGVASKTMSDMNKLMRPEQVAATAEAFKKQSMKMDMTDEIMEEAFDDILADSDEEAESDKVIGQVLDEIGIEISGKMSRAPLPASDNIATTSLTDEDIEKQLSKLRA